jgi:sugar phosphate isomerase/epimerase
MLPDLGSLSKLGAGIPSMPVLERPTKWQRPSSVDAHDRRFAPNRTTQERTASFTPERFRQLSPRRTRPCSTTSHVSISLGEGFAVRPGRDIRDSGPDMDLMLELGVRRINTVSLDPDIGRSLDQFATVVEMAAERGLEMTIEFSPSLTITSLDIALAAIDHVSKPNFRLLIDTMHLSRSSGIPADLAAIDPDLIGYVHLSDNSRHQRGKVYRDDSIDRMYPRGRRTAVA